MANAGKESEVHVLERETRYMLDSDEAPFIRERIEGKEMRAGGRTREGEYGERSLGGSRDDSTGEERRASGMRWGCTGRTSSPFSVSLRFLFTDFLSSRPVTRVDENYSRNVDDLYAPAL